MDPGRHAEEDRPPRRERAKGGSIASSRSIRRPRPIPRLDRLDTAGLVAALDSPSGWQRDTAQRLLMHKNDPAAIEPLRALARDHDQAEDAGSGRLDAGHPGRPGRGDTALTALADSAPAGAPERPEGAARICSSKLPKLAEAALKLVDDPDPHVRLQLALSLGNWTDPRAGQALAQIARRDPDDPLDPRGGAELGRRRTWRRLLVELFRGGGPSRRVRLSSRSSLWPARRSIASAIDSVVRTRSATPAGQGGTYAGWQFAGSCGACSMPSSRIEAADRPGAASPSC